MIKKLKEIYEIGHTSHTTLYSMEGLRGLAVFLVFLVHYISLSEPWISDSDELFYYASLIHSLGNIGVDLFFVLSGYLIYGMLIKREYKFVPYLHRRIERIYPVFIAVFALYLVMSFAFPDKSKIPDGGWEATRYIAENFLLLPGMLAIKPLITVAWSLSYEFFFYLIVPFLIFVLRLRHWPPSSRITFFLILSAVILIQPSFFGNHVRLAMFISGVLVFEVATCYQKGHKYLDIFGSLGLAFALAGTMAQKTFGFSGQWKFAILAASFFFLTLACFTMDGYTSRMFRWTPLRWLGNISYSYYLIHGLTLNMIFLVAPYFFAPTGDNLVVFWLGLAIAFPVTFIVSTLLFMLIEKPFSLVSSIPTRANVPAFAKG